MPTDRATRPRRRALRWILLALGVLFVGPVAALLSGEVDLDRHWSRASRVSAGIAPDPATTPEAVVQVYAARAYGWRGLFGVHSWIAVKPRDAARYTVHQVMGWHVRHGGSAVDSGAAVPDRYWFGNRPRLLAELRGAAAAAAIEAIEAAVIAYPFPDRYRLWPGPNSNTFVAYVARRVPALALDLPANAVGKDYLVEEAVFARAPSGTGIQVSLAGLAGFIAALEEGVEVNLLGLAFGLDLNRPALRLPGIGRLGLANRAPAG